MLIKSRNKIDQTGDTIVEVLICIAIVGAAIMAAYSLASNSLQEGISSSQHTQAIKIAESQVELLKYRQNASIGAAAWTQFTAAANTHFCIKSGIDPSDSANWAPVQQGSSPDTLIVDATHYKAACTQDNSRYFIDITKGLGTNPTFLVTIRWIPPGAGPLSQTQLYYRF